MRTFILTSILLVLMVFHSKVHSSIEDWSKKDQALFNSFIVLNTIDTLQTWDMLDCQRHNPKCSLREKNIILGPTPNKTDVLLLKVGTTYALYHLLDNLDSKKHPRVRTITLGIVNAMYVKTVYDNHEVGLRFGFAF